MKKAIIMFLISFICFKSTRAGNDGWTYQYISSTYQCNNGSLVVTIQPAGIAGSLGIELYAVSYPSNNLHVSFLASIGLGGSPNNSTSFSNLAPGPYMVYVSHFTFGGTTTHDQVYFSISEVSTGCPPPTVASVTSASSPFCNDGVVVMSNGDVFSGLAPGYHTISGNYNCYCGVLPYNVFPTVGNYPYNLDFSAAVTDPMSCSAGSISLNVINSSPCITYYTAAVYDENGVLVSNNTINPGDFPYNISLAQGGVYTVTMNAYSGNTGPYGTISHNLTLNKLPCFTLSTNSSALTYKTANDGTIIASLDNYGSDCSAQIDLFDAANTLVGQWAAAGNTGPAVFANLAAGTYRAEAHGTSCNDVAFVTVADGPCKFTAANFVITQAPTLSACNSLQVRYSGTGNYNFGYRNNDAPYNEGPLTYNTIAGLFESSGDLPSGQYSIAGSDGVCSDSTMFNYIARTLPVALLTGPDCLGSGTLKLAANGTGIQSTVWKRNDSILQTSTLGWAANGTTVAGGNGPGSGANQLSGPHDVFTDAQGNLYVSEITGARVSKWGPGATNGITVATNVNASGIYVDGGGNLYVADRVNNTVTKWIPGAVQGIVVAGGNGAGDALNQLSGPNDIVVDSAGNVFVTELFGARVVKWAPGATEGVIIAGGNGAGDALNQLNWPAWLAMDAAGNLYVTDYQNSRVMKLVPGATQGVVVAGGNGNGNAANQLSYPTGIYVDAVGDIFIGDLGNARVQEWKPGAIEGTTVTGAGQLSSVYGVSIDHSGNMYAADYGTNSVQKFSLLGVDTTYNPALPGVYTVQLTDANGCTAISQPFTVSSTLAVSIRGKAAICAGGTTTLTASGGSSYKWLPGNLSGATQTLTSKKVGSVKYTVTAANSNNTCFGKDSVMVKTFVKPVVTISATACIGSTFIAKVTKSAAEDIAWQFNGNTVKTSSTNWQTARSTAAGGYGPGSFANQFNGPTGIYKDAKGNLYISDETNNRVQKWAPGATQGITIAGGNGLGGAPNQLAHPGDVFVDKAGYIYIADVDNNRIQKWSPKGMQPVTVAGGNGAGNALNQLSQPTGIFVDDFGNIYVADANNDRIMKCAPGAATGTMVAAGSHPLHVYVDNSGNIYVANYNSKTVEKWAPGSTTGVVVAGGNGGGNAANQISNPAGLFADDLGNVYVSDRDPAVDRVQRWSPGATEGVTVLDGNAAGSLAAITGIYLDAKASLYTNGYYNEVTLKFNPQVDTTFIPAATGNYRVIATDFNGCSDTSNNFVIKSIVPKKPGAITGQKTSLCGGSFNYSIAPVTNANTYTWTAPPNTSIVSGQGTTAITLTVAGSFSTDSLKVAGNNTCTATTGAANSLVLSALPATPVYTGPLSVTANQTNIQFTIANNEPAVTYTWAFPSGVVIVSGQGTNTVAVNWGSKAGTLSVYGSNGCGKTVTVKKTIKLAVPLTGNIRPATGQDIATDDNEELELSIYPNPAINEATVVFTANKESKYILALTDAAGRQVLLKEGDVLPGKNNIKLGLGNYAQGMYFIKLEYGNGLHILKLIKQ